MNDYDIKNHKLAGATSSIKAALFDIISELNTKILSLEDGPEKEALTERLKSIMKLTDSFYDEVVLTDKNISGEEIDNSSSEEVVTSEDEEDNTVEISDKAIDEMMNIEDEEDVTEVNLEGTEEEPKKEEVEEKPVPKEEDRGDAIVVNFAEYQKLKNRTLEQKSPEVKNDDNDESKLFDLDNVKEETDSKEKEEEKVEESVEEKVEEPVEETNDEEPIVVNFAEYQKLKNKKLEPVSEENVEDENNVSTEVEEVNVEEAPAEESVEEIEVKEETPKLDETEQAIEDQKQTVTTKTISYIINKDNIDVAKAILVTSLQYEKLLLSRDDQKTLCKLRKYMVMPGENKEEEVSLEELLQQAENLYRQGDTQGAEELYNKISELNGN